MPCCCAKNVKAAFVLGIVLAVLNFLSCLPFCFAQNTEILVGISIGVIGVMTHCILIFGAHKRHSIAILVWMVLAILECTLAYILAGLIFFLLLLIHPIFEIGIFLSVYIILLIWTIIVAENARKEIKADGSDLELGSI